MSPGGSIMLRRLVSNSWLARLGITLLILSLARVPLPIPDFSNYTVLCQGHDHPDGTPTGSTSIQWRWVVLSTAALCGSNSSVGSEDPDCHPDCSSCEHDPSPHFLHSR